jgi:sugar transferase (PEP-CTERM system associated)
VVPHPRPAFVAAELALLLAAALYCVTAGMHLAIPLLVAFCGLFFHVGAVDKSIVEQKGGRFLIEALVCVGMGICASLLVLRLFPAAASGAWPGVGTAAVWCLLAAALPVAMRPVLRYLVAHRQLTENVLIVGAGELAVTLSRIAADGWSHAKSRPGPVSLPGSAVAVDLARLDEIMERDQISRVIVAEQNAEHRKALAKALLDRRLQGVQIDEAVRLYERFSRKIWVEGLNWEWFVYADGVHRSGLSLALKRVFDVVFAVLLIVAASPLMAIIALAIRLDSRGPVLFRQLRVGLREKTFYIFKFRSMRQDAECETGPVWARECDDRVTRVGRILRRFRLDEIPQAFNVLRGEMSVIGPRPERPFFVNELAKHIPFYNLRHHAKPGITGWAQVMYRYGDSFEDSLEKLQYDFYYSKHGSFFCDARILLKTIKIVLLGRGR